MDLFPFFVGLAIGMIIGAVGISAIACVIAGDVEDDDFYA